MESKAFRQRRSIYWFFPSRLSPSKSALLPKSRNCCPILTAMSRPGVSWSSLTADSGGYEKIPLAVRYPRQAGRTAPEEGTAEELFAQIQAEKQWLIKAGKIKKEKSLPAITDDEKPFEIPESWMWVRLLDVCKTIADGDHQAPPQVPSGIPFLVISNISKGNLDFSNTRYVTQEYFDSLAYERIAESNDILFSVTGSYGIPVIVDCEQSFAFRDTLRLSRYDQYKLFMVTSWKPGGKSAM